MIKKSDIIKAINFYRECGIVSIEKLEKVLFTLKKKYSKETIASFLLFSLFCQGISVAALNNSKSKQITVDISSYLAELNEALYNVKIGNGIMNLFDDELIAAVEEQVNKTDEEKVLEKYSLTKEQLDVIIAIVAAEAGTVSYEENYKTINSIWNRAHSKRWSGHVSQYSGKDGRNIYNQVICDGQYNVYASGAYKKYLGVQDIVTYQAVINFLLTEEPVTNNMSFFSNGDGTNHFYDELTEEDRIIEPISEIDNDMKLKMQR